MPTHAPEGASHEGGVDEEDDVGAADSEAGLGATGLAGEEDEEDDDEGAAEADAAVDAPVDAADALEEAPALVAAAVAAAAEVEPAAVCPGSSSGPPKK